jgi:hypothetical protein
MVVTGTVGEMVVIGDAGIVAGVAGADFGVADGELHPAIRIAARIRDARKTGLGSMIIRVYFP